MISFEPFRDSPAGAAWQTDPGGKYIVYYYKELNICQVMNGNHSIAAGIYTEKGTVLAKIVDMKPLFENLKTDGAYYYSIHNNTIIEEVQDFRIAVIFEIAKMKYKLENELEP